EVALKCDVLRAARTGSFIRTPTDRAMVHDAVVGRTQAGAIHRFPGNITNSETHVADDDIMRAIGTRRKVSQANAIAGRSLAGNRAIRLAHSTWPFKANQAGYAEDDRARDISFDCSAETARDDRLAFGNVVVLEICHFDDASATAATSESSVTF